MNDALNDLSDPVYPDIATVLDPEKMKGIIAEAVAPLDDSREILEAKVADVNYDPGNRCNLLFELKVRKRSGGRTRRQMMTARLLQAGEEAPAPPKAKEVKRFKEAHASHLPGPFIVTKKPPIVLATFPYDPAMPWMVDGLDAQQMRRSLSRLWSPEGARAARVRINLLGYTPRMRASMHYVARRLDEDASHGLSGRGIELFPIPPLFRCRCLQA